MKSEGPIRYRMAKSISGKTHPMRLGKRNGRPSAFFEPSWTTGEIDEECKTMISSFALPLDAFDALTDIERATWASLLTTNNISLTATELRVTRQAIYARIRGTNSQGGMIKKNKWVARWWSLRSKSNRR
jgi:hypothetical protein